jgi:sporulation protein YlmC with PRC-barrel domain
MKRTITFVAGLTLASGIGFAQQQQETEEYDPNRDITTETERDRDMGMEPQQHDTPVESDWGTEPESDYETGTATQQDPTQPTERDYGTEPGQTGETGTGLSEMTAEELRGQTIVTADGEEIGEINEVGYSSTHQERVATVEVGGFLGVGQKQIAIPLSKIQKSVDDPDRVQTSMTRESIESEEEFDETGFEVGQDEEQY